MVAPNSEKNKILIRVSGSAQVQQDRHQSGFGVGNSRKYGAMLTVGHKKVAHNLRHQLWRFSDAAAVHDLVVELFEFGLVLCLFIRQESKQIVDRPGFGGFGELMVLRHRGMLAP